MNENKDAVKDEVKTAATSQENVSAQSDTQVDYEALLKKKDEEISQIRQEKENYRKGMLKAKGKVSEEDQSDAENPENNIEAIVDRKVKETLLATKEAQAQAERDDITSKLLKRNKELELALKNRGQVTASSALGSNQERTEANKSSYFSNEQIQAFKAKGYDDKKIERIKENMIKGNKMP